MIKFFFGEGVYISYYLDLKFFFIKFHPHQGLVSPDNVKKKNEYPQYNFCSFII